MSERIFLCHAHQVTEQAPFRFNVGEGEQIVVFRTPEGFFAVENRCPHAGAYLHEGHIEDNILTCPWHGWRFDLESGQSLTEYWARLKTYPIQIVEGKIFLIKEESL